VKKENKHKRRVFCSVTNDVSQEHIASIFRVEEIISAKTSKQAGGKQQACWFLLKLFLRP
jgi:hypothetical protein